MPDVSFSGRRVPLEDVQEHPGRYARALEHAKITPGYALCHCRADAPRQLVIRRYGSLYHLAGWPDDGVHHQRGCDFHNDPTHERTGARGNTTAAIVNGPDGLDARLNARLTAALMQGATAPGASDTKNGTSDRVSRRRAALLALLQALWHNARLTAWSSNSGTRGWGAVNTMLLGGLGENAKINGCPVHLVLYIMRRYEESERESINAEFNEFLNRLTNDGKLKRRALIVGELGELADMRFGKAITLRQRRHRYFCTDALIEHAAKTYPHAWRAIGVAGARVVLMMLIERTTNGYVRVVDLAAMLCSSTFLPCDSIHEVAMANRLVNERRVFERPMRLAEGDDMLPDFVLLDTRPATHVEVYGMNGLASYEQRKSAKQALRLARGIPVVEWNIDRESLESVALPPPEARA